MSQPADTPSPEGQPPADPQPRAYGSPYGQAPGAPPPSYGQAAQGGQPYAYGYGTPPPQGHAPHDGRWGYGPPGNPGGPRTQPMGDDTTWAMFCYVGTLVAGFIAPLVIYFVKRNESGFVRHHAAQMLNYTLTVLIQIFSILAIAIALFIATEHPAPFIVMALLFVVHVIAQYVFLILGAIKSSKGEWYRIPTWTCWRMIR